MSKKNKSDDTFFKSIEWITSSIGWLQIFISPFASGLIIGLVIYLLNPTWISLLIGGTVTILGLIFGIKWANTKWKSQGTVEYMSKIIATPELDKDDSTIKNLKD